MKIGDRILVSGVIDEIRKDIVIVKNDGGYFGTPMSEIVPDTIRCKSCTYCKNNMFDDSYKMNEDRKVAMNYLEDLKIRLSGKIESIDKRRNEYHEGLLEALELIDSLVDAIEHGYKM